MSLNQCYKDLEMFADMYVPDWRMMTKTQLANSYCDADEEGNETVREGSLYGLMCKYWYMIPYFYTHNRFMRYEIEDFVSWLYEALMLGLQYRRWRDPEFEVSKLENGAEKVFNRCFFTIRNRYIVDINRDKHKINYMYTSLDEEIGEELSLVDIVEDRNSRYEFERMLLSMEREDIVSAMLKDRRFLDAVMSDIILSDLKITKADLADRLKKMTADDITKFETKYNCIVEENLVEKLSSMSTRGMKCLITYKMKELEGEILC